MENIEKLLKAIVDDYARFSENPERSKMFSRNMQLRRGRKYYVIILEDGRTWGFVQRYNDTKFRIGDILKANNSATPARNIACGNVILEQFDQVCWWGPNSKVLA